MVSKSVLFLSVIVLFSQNTNAQIIPVGGGCGCQQMPAQPNLPINNCGCNNLQLANLPNNIQIANNLQLAKLQSNVPCGCVPNNLITNNCNNLQLANFGNGLQLANGMQMANLPLSQNDLLTLINGISMPNYQSILQLSMQSLLNQLGNNLPVNCPCGCQQTLAPNTGCLNNNNINLLKAFNNLQMGVQNQPITCSNMPVLNNMNGMPMTGTPDIVLNNSPTPCANPNTMSFTVYH